MRHPEAIRQGLLKDLNCIFSATAAPCIPVGKPSFRTERSAVIEDSDPVGRNLSFGFSDGFSSGFYGAAAGLLEGAFGEFVLATVKYLRIFLGRFAPRPRSASKSSRLLKAPYDLRICKIFCAGAGPIPGTC